jgi:uncharacterized protein YkwD
MVGCVSSPTQDTQYDLTISSTEGGEITALGEGTFTCDEGEVVNLVATPASGCQFVNWTGDVDTIENIEAASTTITMNGDCSITANFEAILAMQHSLTVSSTAGGSVVLPGEGIFACNTGMTANLVATPDAGHRFINWSGDVDTIVNIEAASTAITMNEDYSITANFVAQHVLETDSPDGGEVTAPGEGAFVYDTGAVVDLVAEAGAGYQFVNWTGDVGTVANTNAASTTITMNGDHSITANFSNTQVTYYTLTMAVSGSGSTSPAVGQHTYAEGTVVPIIATPASGYRFVNWTGNVGTIANVNAASTAITMNADYSITANFEQIPAGQFDLNTSSTTGGSVTVPGEGTFMYDAGTVVSLVATPTTGYEFVNWTGDVGTIANVNAASTTITMSGSYSITATFLEDSPGPPGIGYTEAEAEALIIVLVNGQRQLSGLPALSEDPLLASLAKEHSISMVEHNFFSHDRYPGERSFSYGQLPGTIRGENIAMIPTRQFIPGPYLSLQEVCGWAVSAWMSSSGHRANILGPSYTRTGVGVSFSEGGDYVYITQMFEGYY